jgi:RNA polymerase sigma-70 factor (ECF subfamily)
MIDTEDERQLVEAAQRDPSQFAALYERHVGRVYAFVFVRVHDRDVAEDLTADVFHKALKNLGGFEWRGAPFGAWLIRIAANAVADRRRRPSREASSAPDARDALEALQAPEVPGALDDFEDRARLYRCVDELPEPQRTVIVERFAHERSLREVAAKLGKSEGAIKQIQLRALRTLRTRMEGGHA